MKNIAFLISSSIILVAINFLIYEKEQILKNGSSILLELAPVDPRSLIQGDYMVLRYALDNTSSTGKQNSGHMVVVLDKNNVAKFKRYYAGENLAVNEKLIKYKKASWRSAIYPRSFLFQEGHAKYYDKARYGEFKVKNNTSLLIGLRDKNFKKIEPPLNK